MKINKLIVKNYKTFNNLNISLDQFNVIVGSNASGKSNFLSIFKFLKDISFSGLENAIQLHGGPEYIKNINTKGNKNLSIELNIDFDIQPRLVLSMKPDDQLKENERFEGLGMTFKELKYKFEISFNSSRKYKVINEDIKFKGDLSKLTVGESQKIKEDEFHKGSTITFSRDPSGKVTFKTGAIQHFIKSMKHTQLPILPMQFVKVKHTELFLLEKAQELGLSILPPIATTIQNISSYDFDCKASKTATPISVRNTLESDGSNLPIVLKRVLNNPDTKKQFYSLIRDCLPFIDSYKTRPLLDKSIMLEVKEIYQSQYLPSLLLSDGTISITAIIIALYFENNSLIILEEPERNVHPALVSKVIDFMKDVSETKQVIISTHNPEVVKYAGQENIVFISRNKKGNSIMTAPKNNEEIQVFLENELGIEELFIQNLLT